MAKSNVVLVIADTHFPAVEPGYLDFLRGVQKKYKTNKTVHIGDVVDHHCISRHIKVPELYGALDEYKAAMKQLKEFAKAFPDVVVTEGNHDSRVRKIASEAGVPQMYLKDYDEIYPVGWKWVPEIVIDKVLYSHGIGTSGLFPAFNLAKSIGLSTVCGHHHTKCGIQWLHTNHQTFFGMNVGCGIDAKSYAMAYGQHNIAQPVLACGVVIDGKLPYIERYNPS